jgi:hypothetical protein
MYAGHYSVAGKRLHPLAIKARERKQEVGEKEKQTGAGKSEDQKSRRK